MILPAARRIGAVIICAFADADTAEPTLTVVAGGRTAIYTPTGLLALPSATSVSVPADFAYRRSMMFRALPMSVLLDGTAPDETVRIAAVDRSRPTPPAPALLPTG